MSFIPEPSEACGSALRRDLAPRRGMGVLEMGMCGCRPRILCNLGL